MATENMTMSVDKELRKRMRRHPEIRWTHVVRQAIEEKLDQLETLERIASKSRLTVKDAVEIGRKINRGLARRYGLGAT